MSTTIERAATAGVDTRPRRSRLARRGLGLAVLLLVLALVAAASVTFGARHVGLTDLLAALTGGDANIAQAAVAKRIPRTLLAAVVGAALGVAGAVMQGLTRNPLADPGILGVTSGASLAVVSGIAFFGLSSPVGYAWVAVLGSACAAVLVYVVGSLGRGGATPLKLTLAGAATSAAFSSLISAVLLPRVEVMDSFRFWQIGGVGGADVGTMSLLSPFLLVGLALCLVTAGGLDALALGDDVAAGLGENVVRTRLVAALGAVLLCGAATALAGPIGFVGLVVPHACRLVAGSAHRRLLPCSALTGATLLIAADVVGRVVARPDEIDVGVVTALIGAPVFIAIVRRQKARAL
ncbi:FecCD family ABC transporter permease [Mobilicoccus massiliensis]|uniref:FecCD family ABC transporter permease n=1 Tax=Mobilicoccus massiliensis TaxID=1522310 RepID=UPI0006950C1D|nr:iron ABC transporter permease [Mobilicoccus massiliensis]